LVGGDDECVDFLCFGVGCCVGEDCVEVGLWGVGDLDFGVCELLFGVVVVCL